MELRPLGPKISLPQVVAGEAPTVDVPPDVKEVPVQRCRFWPVTSCDCDLPGHTSQSEAIDIPGRCHGPHGAGDAWGAGLSGMAGLRDGLAEWSLSLVPGLGMLC